MKMHTLLGQCWLSLKVGEQSLGRDTVRNQVKN